MKPDLKVLLIGGASATGKTNLSKQLAEKLGFRIIKVDDIRYFMQHVVSKDEYPSLFRLYSHDSDIVLKNTEEFLVNSYLDIGQLLAPGINCLINKYTKHESGGVIIEGIDIYPNFIIIEDPNNVKSIFLYDEFDSLLERNLNRNRGHFSKEFYNKETTVQKALSDIIVEQAKSKGMITIKSSPASTLLSRVLEVI